MDHETKIALLFQSLEKYPASLLLDEAAEALGVSRRTVERLAEAGTLETFPVNPATERPGRRVSKAALVQYMANNTNRKEELTHE